MTQIDHKAKHKKPRQRDFEAIVLLSDVCKACRSDKPMPHVALGRSCSSPVNLNHLRTDRLLQYAVSPLHCHPRDRRMLEMQLWQRSIRQA